MVEFNHTYLASLVFAGFKYIVYVPNEDHAQLLPVRKQVPEIVLQTMGAWQVPICEREVVEMAIEMEEDLLDFKFYISEKLFQHNGEN